MPDVTFREANRRYKRAYWPVMIFYALFCFAGAAAYAFMDDPPKWIVGLIAIITGAPIAGVLWLMGRFLRETDEYTRHLQTQALLSGGGITVSVAAVWSFLELYEVVPRFEQFPSMMMVAPAFFLFYGASYYVQQRRRGASAGGALKGSLDPLCMRDDA
jgi:cytochrome bd-type quinol oxidase subunit 2